MTAAEKRIGHARCPICGSEGASATLMKTQRVCITCNACKCQCFARGDESDAHMRARIVGSIERNAEPAPTAKPAAPAPAQAEPRRQSWGIGAW